MGTVHKFKKRARQRGRGTAYRRQRWPKPSHKSSRSFIPLTTLALAVVLGGLAGYLWFLDEQPVPEGSFGCVMPRIIDGDTFDCGGTRVRLQGIDAPETEGHCRPGRDCAPGDANASTANLRSLVRWHKVICRPTDIDGYGRTVARCSAGEVDLSCSQVKDGHAILRYAPISC